MSTLGQPCARCSSAKFDYRTVPWRKTYGSLTYRIDLDAEICVTCGALYRRAADEQAALRRVVRELALEGVFHSEALRAMRVAMGLGVSEMALILQHPPSDLARWETNTPAPPTVRLVYGLMALEATGRPLSPIAYALHLAEKRLTPPFFPREQELKLYDDVVPLDSSK